MSNDNRPKPDLRTTPDRYNPWISWIAVLAIMVVTLLAWGFWPYDGRTDLNGSAQITAQPSTTTPPAVVPVQQ